MIDFVHQHIYPIGATIAFVLFFVRTILSELKKEKEE